MYNEILKQISVKFKLLPIIGKDKDGNYYCYFYNIRVLNRRFLFTQDTGYGKNEDEAIENLFKIYLNRRFMLRRKTNKGYIYFTTKMRKELKKLLKQMKESNND